MFKKNLRRVLLLAPLAMVVACSLPTNASHPEKTTTKPRQVPSQTGIQQPTTPDTLNTPQF